MSAHADVAIQVDPEIFRGRTPGPPSSRGVKGKGGGEGGERQGKEGGEGQGREGRDVKGQGREGGEE